MLSILQMLVEQIINLEGVEFPLFLVASRKWLRCEPEVPNIQSLPLIDKVREATDMKPSTPEQQCSNLLWSQILEQLNEGFLQRMFPDEEVNKDKYVKHIRVYGAFIA